MPPKSKNTEPKVKAPPAVVPTPAPTEDSAEGSKPTTSTAVSKPDQAAHQAEQDALKKEIDELQAKLNAVKEKINLAKGGGGANERRDALRAELDAIRGQQGSNKASRSKILDQIQALQNGVQTKIKTLQASRGKVPYKSPAEVDAQITKLTKSVESGAMKIVDERKALQEISSLRRMRKTVESFQSEQDEIEAERAKVEELRKQLDDPEVRAISDKYEKIKAELDGLKKESDSAYEGRSKLFDERTEITGKLEEVWKRKKEAQAAYKERTDVYWKKVNEERAKRAEKAVAAKKADEEARKRAIAEELLEHAKEPAYGAEIQDCQTLIDFFSRSSGGSSSSNGANGPGLYIREEVAGVPKLELRKVENSMEGLTLRKKKGEDENNYFVASKKSNKKGVAPSKAAASATSSTPEPTATSSTLQIPFGTLSALMALSIPPPTSSAEVPRVIEDLNTKKAWYLANQAKTTKENVAKAEAEIKRLNATQAKVEETATAVEA